MKMIDIMHSHHALMALSQTGLRASVSIKVSRVQLAVAEEYKVYLEARKQKIENLELTGKVNDQDGVLIIPEDATDEDRGKYTESYKTLLKELEEMKQQESTFSNDNEVIDVDDLKKANGTEVDILPAILSELNWLII